MITSIVILLLLGLFLLGLSIEGFCFGLGLVWAKAERVTFRRVAGLTLLITLALFPFSLSYYFILVYFPAHILTIAVVNLAAAILVPFLIIMWMFKISFFRAVQALLPTIVGRVIIFAFVYFIFCPYLIESYRAPTNSMAPTILGEHWQGKCATCGKAAFCTPMPEEYMSDTEPLMICQDHFHITHPTEYGDKVIHSDRFLVAKFIKPRRWDIVTFRFPGEPSVYYVKRLVGLPGEEIIIKQGQVYADGRLLTPPDALRGIQYLSSFDEGPSDMWGSPEKPAQLGPDEYFVLGDFTKQSQDSRLWDQGAPGHNSFAVPESYMSGVVTNIYWPPSRWRAFR